jgi:hypothetical protein
MPVADACLAMDRVQFLRDKVQLPRDKEQLLKDKAQLPKDKVQLLKDKAQLPRDKEQLPKDKVQLRAEEDKAGGKALDSLPLDRALVRSGMSCYRCTASA